MIIKNKFERKILKEACFISTQILQKLYDAVEIGVTTLEVDDLAWQLCRHWDVRPAFYGVRGNNSVYNHATCIQLNDEVVHGLPKKIKISNGDLVTVDFGIIYEGFYTDHCFSVGVGQVSQANLDLLTAGRETVLAAVKLAVVDNTVGDLGYAMINKAQKFGFDTVKEYVGHGIGKNLHQAPEIPAFGYPKKGIILQKGMVLCVEAQVVAGQDKVKVDNDSWTVRTQDGQNSVMFEYMVLVDKQKPFILTPTENWPLVK